MKTLIIGYGNIGKIYADSFLKYKIIDTTNLHLLQRNGKVILCNGEEIIQKHKYEIIILSVKPQDYNKALNNIQQHINQTTIVLSVMAGITIRNLQESLNHKKIVRAMPNSPIELGMGITGFTAAEGMSFGDIRKAEQLLATTGRTVYIDVEQQLNAVTALSGSGPAYVFYFIQSMIDAGVQMGFTESTSTTLVKQTLLGAFHLFNESGKSTENLIKTVASKGGTTEAALETFNRLRVSNNIVEGILNAEKRAEGLQYFSLQ